MLQGIVTVVIVDLAGRVVVPVGIIRPNGAVALSIRRSVEVRANKSVVVAVARVSYECCHR